MVRQQVEFTNVFCHFDFVICSKPKYCVPSFNIDRFQAALLLVNLTSQTMLSGGVDGVQTTWQGPVVTDTEYEVS